MTDSSRFERRIAVLVATYADRAPTEVDPVVMAKVVAGLGRRGAWTHRSSMDLRLLVAMVSLALLVGSLAGALVAGGRTPPADPLRTIMREVIVPPFTGLPPAGAPASTPEDGRLVLQFVARIVALGYDVHAMWLYDDGRLIWKRNLDGLTESSGDAFGDFPPSRAVIEQRLTPAGVEQLRQVASSASPPLAYPTPTSDPAQRSDVVWGELAVDDGQGLVYRTWADDALPMKLADPGTWLPVAAWADARIGAYVPAHYNVCVGFVEELPERARTLLLARAESVVQLSLAPTTDASDPRVRDAWWCADPAGVRVRLATDDARAFAAALDEAGGVADETAGYVDYTMPDGPAPGLAGTKVSFVGILPDGGPITYGG